MEQDRLNDLVEMAHEAELFERELETPVLQHGAAARDQAGGVRSRRRVRLVGVLALLAVMALGVGVVVLSAKLGGAPARGPMGPKGASVAARSGHQDMLIALYRADEPSDASGKPEQCPECWCVQRWKPEWRNVCDAAVVRGEELIDASIERACVNKPSRVVVIGLSGPAEALPKSDEQAREVALCILDAQAESGPVCVASGVDVRVETWKR